MKAVYLETIFILGKGTDTLWEFHSEGLRLNLGVPQLSTTQPLSVTPQGLKRGVVKYTSTQKFGVGKILFNVFETGLSCCFHTVKTAILW